VLFRISGLSDLRRLWGRTFANVKIIALGNRPEQFVGFYTTTGDCSFLPVDHPAGVGRDGAAIAPRPTDEVGQRLTLGSREKEITALKGILEALQIYDPHPAARP